MALGASAKKRIKAANFDQPRRGQCIICGKDWMTCPHTRADIEVAILAVKLEELK